MRSPRERYHTDPQFKALVDMMVHHIIGCDFTPSEMREAAMVASIKYYEMRPEGILVRADQLHELALKLEGK